MWCVISRAVVYLNEEILKLWWMDLLNQVASIYTITWYRSNYCLPKNRNLFFLNSVVNIAIVMPKEFAYRRINLSIFFWEMIQASLINCDVTMKLKGNEFRHLNPQYSTTLCLLKISIKCFRITIFHMCVYIHMKES